MNFKCNNTRYEIIEKEILDNKEDVCEIVATSNSGQTKYIK